MDAANIVHNEERLPLANIHCTQYAFVPRNRYAYEIIGG